MRSEPIAGLVKRGLKHPGKVPPFVLRKLAKWRQDLKYERYRRQARIPKQKDLIHDFLENDEFVLIILDSCRYDAFAEEYAEYFSGDLDRSWSEANLTHRWMKQTWDGPYELTYVSTTPYTFDYAHDGSDFKPSEVFAEVVDVIGSEWNPVLSTTPPQAVTDIALQHFARANRIRSVVHYMQPHQPYIGETKILQWGLTRDEIDRLIEAHETGDPGLNTEIGEDSVTVEQLVNSNISYEEERQLRRENYKDVHEQVMEGDITEIELQRAYRDNLKHVLPEVKRLVRYVDCPVVISADHGEHLGAHFDEVPEYNHPNWTHPVLREVPWFIVADESKGADSLEDLEQSSDYALEYESSLNDDQIDDRLAALGYR